MNSREDKIYNVIHNHNRHGHVEAARGGGGGGGGGDYKIILLLLNKIKM